MPDKKKRQDEDEITLAKSIFDEIVEETESDDWKKESRASKKPTRETEKDSKQTVKEAA